MSSYGMHMSAILLMFIAMVSLWIRGLVLKTDRLRKMFIRIVPFVFAGTVALAYFIGAEQRLSRFWNREFPAGFVSRVDAIVVVALMLVLCALFTSFFIVGVIGRPQRSNPSPNDHAADPGCGGVCICVHHPCPPLTAPDSSHRHSP